MQLKAEEYYPGFTRKIYLKGLRYNEHLRPRSALIEVGAQTNTFEEAKMPWSLWQNFWIWCCKEIENIVKWIRYFKRQYYQRGQKIPFDPPNLRKNILFKNIIKEQKEKYGERG